VSISFKGAEYSAVDSKAMRPLREPSDHLGMIPKKPALGLDPRVDTGFRKKIMLHQKTRAG
jgi:hypothetical protein